MKSRRLFCLVAFAVVARAGVAAASPEDAEKDSPLDRWTRELSHPDLGTRREAAYQIAQLDAAEVERLGAERIDETVDALARALGDSDQQVWFQSITALARFGPRAKNAVAALSEQLGAGSRRGGQRVYRAAYALGRIGSASVAELTERLASESASTRAGAALAFSWVGEAGIDALPELVYCLGDESVEVRRRAGEALVSFGANAVPPLVAQLSSARERANGDASASSEHRTLGLIAALGELGPDARGAAAELLAFARSTTPSLRAAALGSLRKTDAPVDDYASLVGPALADADAGVRSAAEIAVIKVSALRERVLPDLIPVLESDDTAAARSVASVIARIGARSGLSSATLVTAIRGARDDVVRRDLAGALARSEDAVPSILGALEDDALRGPAREALEASLARAALRAQNEVFAAIGHASPAVRAGAVSTLGVLAESGAPVEQAFTEALADSDARVRASAARAAASVDQETASAFRDALSSCARDPDAFVRAAALEALAAHGGDPREITRAIAEALGSSEREVRLAALRAARRVGSAAGHATKGIAALLSEESDELRVEAVGTIRAIGSSAAEAVPSLVRIVEENPSGVAAAELRLAAVDAIGAIGPGAGDASPALGRVAASGDSSEMRLASLSALTKIGAAGANASEQAREALRAKDAEVRAAAAKAIAAIHPDPKAVAEILTECLRDDSPGVRNASIEALGDLGDDAQIAVPILFDLLESRYERRAAFEALRKIGPRSVPLLVKALDHEHPFVKGLAARRLGELGAESVPAVEVLRKIVQNDKTHWRLRSAAEESLKKIEAAVKASSRLREF